MPYGWGGIDWPNEIKKPFWEREVIHNMLQRNNMKYFFPNGLLTLFETLHEFIWLWKYVSPIKPYPKILCIVDLAPKWPPICIPPQVESWDKTKIQSTYSSLTQHNDRLLKYILKWILLKIKYLEYSKCNLLHWHLSRWLGHFLFCK